MKPNISPFERVFRTLLGLLLALIALSQPEIGLLEIVALIAAAFLILNGVYAHCYLWRWLGLNTAQNDIELCNRTLRKRD
ncbi:MAG: YgaP-like transmembrane domain [Pseudomonadota bacterium]